MKLENRNICFECGGKCCKNCGCDFMASDFERLDIDYLQSKINEGFVSIACCVTFLPDHTKRLILRLRMRNVGSPVVDLIPVESHQCSALTPNGCMYDFAHRPSGGKMLIPNKNHICTYAVPENAFALSWLPYQELLGQLITINTGLSVEQKFSQEVEEKCYQCLVDLQNGYDSSLFFFSCKIDAQTFPEEISRAYSRFIKEYGPLRRELF